MKVGIVGARARSKEQDRAEVFALVADLANAWGEELVIVSGGASGIDTFAAEAARELGVPCMVIRPEPFPRNSTRERINQAYYDRNLKIVLESDEIHAFVCSERRGGTENTIGHAKRENKRVEIHLPVPDVEP